MSNTIPLIMLQGGDGGAHPLIAAMRQLRQACARDELQRVQQSGAYGPLIVATDDADWARSLDDLHVTIDLDSSDLPFHFGRRLAEIVDRHQLDRFLYLGAAAAPLLEVDQYGAIAAAIREADRVVVTNNLHSSDWAAVTPASTIDAWAERLENDNSLGWVLSHEAGLSPLAWSASPASRLDIDVPVDAQIAALHPACGRHLREAVHRLAWDDNRLRAARAVMSKMATRVILAGRVPSWAWAQMERSTQCWVRVYSEERGMRAAGRLQAGQGRSLLNEHLHAVGLRQFVAGLCELADTILFDTRVLWAANGLWPSASDRYASDLGLVNLISEPFIRDFTRAIVEASIPIVTGGPTLVSGGLWALLEASPAGFSKPARSF